MIKAIVFDFDGLIVDTESVWFDVFKEVMIEYDCDLKLEDFAICIGTTDDILYERLAQIAHKPIDRTEISRKTRERYQDKMSHLQLREGVLDYLQTAKNLSLKIGLASSSSRRWIEGFLEKFGIKEFFDVIKTSDDVKRVKPDPELYLRAIQDLGVEGHEALAFEDSKNGLTAAIKAGLHCVIVPNPVTSFLDFSGHLYRLSSMGEIGLHDLLALVEAKLARKFNSHQ
ncbi:putative hydrolase of the HAD superfamily [Parageobacillus toebii NBRC 107807]|uniref:Hydrolase of the HAD superfamily n=2 Tax=Parageobacillus TaxID=1906945 RepID=A0AA89SSI3_9BACL|nr:putative hydrolase of the HAD superfamily [Parageobacillus toebii NBRC 107807]OQO99248.1 HAD family hydrolase [Geobacillus sp. 44C]OXB91846.1 HAD family hydrolase [Parageobacillus galactosidasius]